MSRFLKTITVVLLFLVCVSGNVLADNAKGPDLSDYSYTYPADGYPVSSDGYRYADYIPAPKETREERPDLNDEDWVNFRLVSTTGMGKMLYRSSSPINPYLSRAKEADAMLKKYKIKVALNFGNSEQRAKQYAAYKNSYYSKIKVVYLDGRWMSDKTTFNVWYPSKESELFRKNLVSGFNAIKDNKGPYVVHCTWGKDRTGIFIAILEALMGASWDEIREDYLKSYYNFFKVTPDSEEGRKIAKYQIELQLKVIFNVDDLSKANLSECARTYMRELGLSNKNIDKIVDRLKP